jgi:hypothetical protein
MARKKLTMSRRVRIIGVVVLAVVVASGVLVFTQTRGNSSAKNQELIILHAVQRRTLQSTVALNGTLARKDIRNVTAATQGLVSSVYATDDSTVQAGQPLFALDGRDAIAEQGLVPFFRALSPGDEGNDVLQLKQILQAAGDYPGPMTTLFTQQTQFALAQWQAQHKYPNSTPASPQSVTVALQQGTGYSLGDEASAGLIIGAPTAQTTAEHSEGPPAASLIDMRFHANSVTTPVITIQSVDDEVTQGMSATFVVTASGSPNSNVTINLDSGGTAGDEDVVAPPSSIVLPVGQTTTTFSVQTRVNTLIEENPTIVMSIASGSSYTVGTPASAQTTIKNNNVPTLQITGGATVTPGSDATISITANEAPSQDTQVALNISGSALAGTDYNPVDPVAILPAGSISTTITIATLNDDIIQPDRYIVVAIAPSSSYSVGVQGSTVLTINGSNATPIVTLSSATMYLQKGQPYDVVVSLSKAVSSPLTINLAYGGTATPGIDYTLPGGNLVVPANQTSISIAIPTVTDNVVESNRTLTVTLASSSSYQIGSENTVSVTMASSVLPKLTISLNTASIAQGQSASFVISSNQPVVMDTSVNFSVQGTAQPGQDYEPLVGAALLRAGQSQVTVTLQSLRTDVTFEPTDMIVGQWPTHIGQVLVKAGVTVMSGEALLSLTEPDLTVTLQASAANRTVLKVGQSCTVQISGALTSSSGTITELDSTPTSIASTTPGGSATQVYEGRIQVPDLAGADGSAVSITVVDQQIDNALTVPIAAVKQNGVGGDVVRVIDRKSGKITEVGVTTGLTDGSYIQVKKGVSAGETVVVEVDQQQ